MIDTIGNFLYDILDSVGQILPRDPFLEFFQYPDATIYKYLILLYSIALIQRKIADITI